MLSVSPNSAKLLQCVLHNITCFTAPRFPSSSGMMSSSQDTEQEAHYFLCSMVTFASVKPTDASNETREDFEKALRCMRPVSAHVGTHRRNYFCTGRVQTAPAEMSDSELAQTRTQQANHTQMFLFAAHACVSHSCQFNAGNKFHSL